MRTYTIEEKTKNIEYLRQLITCTNYHSHLKSKHCKELRQFIDDMVPELNDPFYTYQTKIYWLLNDLHEFPKCQNENCDVVFKYKNVNPKFGYVKYCSSRCANKCEHKKQHTNECIISKYGSLEAYHKKCANAIAEIANHRTKDEQDAINNKRESTCLERYGVKYVLQLDDVKKKSKETRKEKYGNENYVNVDKMAQTKLKRYGDSGYTNPKLREQTMLERYGVKHALQKAEFKKKSEDTAMKHYGVKNGGASIAARNAARKCLGKKYLYDGIKFDSSPELAYYIWLKDHGIDFEYQPHYIEYSDCYGYVHRYYPDFKVEDQLIEIKGDWFIDENGRFKNPYTSKQLTEKMANILNAKFECMKKHNVKLILQSECGMYYKYVKDTYGNKFIRNCLCNKKKC